MSANCVTIDDTLIPGVQSAKEYCEPCFKAYHYASDGTLLPPFVKDSFKVLPVLAQGASRTREPRGFSAQKGGEA